MSEKVCTRCGDTKPLEAFSKNASSRDGLGAALGKGAA